MIDKGYAPLAAISLPHFGSRNGPTELETDAPISWESALEAMGHKVRRLEMTSGLHVIMRGPQGWIGAADPRRERSEEHTSELQSLMRISYAVFCLKKQK